MNDGVKPKRPRPDDPGGGVDVPQIEANDEDDDDGNGGVNVPSEV